MAQPVTTASAARGPTMRYPVKVAANAQNHSSLAQRFLFRGPRIAVALGESGN